MANEIRDAKDGLKTLLSNISGLKVIDYPAGAVHEFPVTVSQGWTAVAGELLLRGV
jgi:hypothetical protein